MTSFHGVEVRVRGWIALAEGAHERRLARLLEAALDGLREPVPVAAVFDRMARVLDEQPQAEQDCARCIHGVPSMDTCLNCYAVRP